MNINNDVFVVSAPPAPGTPIDKEQERATLECLMAYTTAAGVGLSVISDNGSHFNIGRDSTLLMAILDPSLPARHNHTSTRFALPSEAKDDPTHAEVMGVLFDEWVSASSREFLWALIESVIGVSGQRVYRVCVIGNPDRKARQTATFKLIEKLVYHKDRRFCLLD